MELEELKTTWQSTNVPMQFAFSQGMKAARSRSDIARMKVGPIYELAMSAIVAIFLGNTGYENYTNPIYLGSTILLAVINILVAATNVRKLIAISEIDFSKPIIENQRSLAQFRRLAVMHTKWVLIASPLLWGLSIIAVPMGLFHADLVKALGVPYMLGNVLFGIVMVPVGLWIASKLSPRFKERLVDDISGAQARRMSAYLDELRAFSKD